MQFDWFDLLENYWWGAPLLSIVWCAFVIRFRRVHWINWPWWIGVITHFALLGLGVIAYVAFRANDTPGPTGPGVGYIWLFAVATIPFTIPLGLAIYFAPIEAGTEDIDKTAKPVKWGNPKGSGFTFIPDPGQSKGVRLYIYP